MFRSTLVGLSVLALLSANAVAFEQTQVLPKTPEEATEAAVSKGSAPPAEPSVELALPDDATAEKSGPTISLPGIGKIGTLPKLDFGLELLYDSEQSATSNVDEAGDAGVSIRGTVKHKF